MKKTGLIILLVIVGIVVILGMTLLSSYNGLVEKSENVNIARSDVDAELQRRNDLIPNLVNTVKGYAAHEESVYADIAEARSRLMNPGSMSTEELAQADSELSSALSRLMVIVENYPDLKANQNFIGLQDQLEGTENRIKVARTRYNEAVGIYNKKIRTFPSAMIAGMFGFTAETYFEAAPGAEQAPIVEF